MTTTRHHTASPHQTPENRPKLGLKGSSSPGQILNRLAQPDINIYEFHLVEDDLFGDKRIELERWIQFMRDQGIQVYLHHPSSINGVELDVMATDSIMASYFELSTRIIVELCETYDCYTVIHWNYSEFSNDEHRAGRKKNQHTKDNLEGLLARTQDIDTRLGKGRILWENSIAILGTYLSDFSWAEMLAETDINLIFDISHAFISLKGDNDALERTVRTLRHNIKYFHVVDSMGETHDSLPLGQGLIDFKRLKPYITEKNYIYEVGLTNIHDCTQMVDSHEWLKSL